MLMIRLQRIGRKHDPAFRVIVTEKTRGPKSGKFIEKLGFYHAKTGEKKFNSERIMYWIENGAKLSGTVHNFLIDEGIIKGSKINVLPKRKPVKEEESKAQSEEKVSNEETEDKEKEEEQKKEETENNTDAKDKKEGEEKTEKEETIKEAK